MDRLATKIGETGEGGLKVYLGNYSEYRDGAIGAGSGSADTAAAASTAPTSGYKAKQRKAAPSKVEVELDALEAELDRQIDRRTELEDALGQPGALWLEGGARGADG